MTGLMRAPVPVFHMAGRAERFGSGPTVRRGRSGGKNRVRKSLGRAAEVRGCISADDRAQTGASWGKAGEELRPSTLPAAIGNQPEAVDSLWQMQNSCA